MANRKIVRRDVEGVDLEILLSAEGALPDGHRVPNQTVDLSVGNDGAYIVSDLVTKKTSAADDYNSKPSIDDLKPDVAPQEDGPSTKRRGVFEKAGRPAPVPKKPKRRNVAYLKGWQSRIYKPVPKVVTKQHKLMSTPTVAVKNPRYVNFKKLIEDENRTRNARPADAYTDDMAHPSPNVPREKKKGADQTAPTLENDN